jgi:dihydroorotate dehydrogenase (NAD+) catalytic subunit
LSAAPAAVDLTTSVGNVTLPNPVMTASGTGGHGDELAAFVDLASLGAVVVKSMAPYGWPGNPAPRLHAVTAGMVNSVGLQGAGVAAWLRDDLPRLATRRARVVASIWGRTVDDFAEAAALLAGATGVVAVEANLSCPNIEGKGMFAQSPDATHDVVAASSAARLPVWAKLTAMVADLPEVAAAAVDAGAGAVTLINTVPGLVIDVERRRRALGGAGGGLSGAAIHPVAVRAVHDVHAAYPHIAIVGAGGVTDAVTAVELLLAGASAVQVGTATFADPRAPARVLADLVDWCRRHGVSRLAELVGGAHGSP